MDSIKGKRIVCITDVHGNLSAFLRLLETTGFDPQKDTFVFGGDFLDRGKDEYGVFLKLMEMKEQMKERMIWVPGNHEDTLLYLYRYRLPLTEMQREIAGKLEQMHLKSFYEFKEVAFVHGEFSERLNDPLMNLFGGRQISRCEKAYSGKLFIAGHNEVSSPCYVYERIRSNLKDGMSLPGKGAIFYDTSYNPQTDAGGGYMTALIIEDGRIYLVSEKMEAEK